MEIVQLVLDVINILTWCIWNWNLKYSSEASEYPVQNCVECERGLLVTSAGYYVQEAKAEEVQMKRKELWCNAEVWLVYCAVIRNTKIDYYNRQDGKSTFIIENSAQMCVLTFTIESPPSRRQSRWNKLLDVTFNVFPSINRLVQQREWFITR